MVMQVMSSLGVARIQIYEARMGIGRSLGARGKDDDLVVAGVDGREILVGLGVTRRTNTALELTGPGTEVDIFARGLQRGEGVELYGR